MEMRGNRMTFDRDKATGVSSEYWKDKDKMTGPTEYQLKMLALAQAEGLVPPSTKKGLELIEENKRLINKYRIKDAGEEKYDSGKKINQAAA